MDRANIGKSIARLRRGSDLTQEEFGQKLGVTNKTVSRWENGKYMPDIEMLKKIADMFNISVDELLCDEKLNDTDLNTQADTDNSHADKDRSFSVKEDMSFWKKKWLKEHLALLIILIAAFIGVIVLLKAVNLLWLMGADILAGLITFMILRNKMMIYIEKHIYGKR